jgi:hypothetical protein
MNDKPKQSSWAAKSAAQKPDEGPDAPQEAGKADGFSTLNAARRQPQLMLNLRHKNGSSLGLSYAYLSAVVFNPSVGITLEMAGYKVTLQGVNLKKLYRRLLMHAVGSILEVDAFDDQAQGDHPKATAVYSIKAEKA